MSRFLGIDLGTTYFKAGIWDDSGRQCGLGRAPVPKNTGGGRCELPVEDFWKAIRTAVTEALADAGIPASALDGVSYSSQANSFILLDGAMEPLTNLVLWPDGRAGECCDPLGRLASLPDFMEKTGLGIVPDGEFMLAKLDWFRKNRPEIWRSTASVMTISDYLVFGLTDCRAGDMTTASLTALLDVARGCWWSEALEAFCLSAEMFSEPLATGTIVGQVSPDGAAKVGLMPGTPFYAGCLDHYAVAIGAGVTAGGRISESTGTVLACVGYSEGYAPREGVITARGLEPGRFFQLAFNGNGATAVEWYQKNYAPQLTIPQLEALSCKVPVGSDGLVALPRSDSYPGLEGFKNVQEWHTPGHFLRAIFESTAATLKSLVDLLDAEGAAGEVIPSGGGARNRLWLQIKADLLQRDFLIQSSGELATKGAAMLAAGNPSGKVVFDSTIHPNPEEVEKYKQWYKSISI